MRNTMAFAGQASACGDLDDRKPRAMRKSCASCGCDVRPQATYCLPCGDERREARARTYEAARTARRREARSHG